jgi:hypothetical protein
MELDDLKVAWAQLDQRVGHLEALAGQQNQKRSAGDVRRVLRTLGWYQTVQAVVWVLAIMFVAPFWIEHRTVPHLLVAGLVLHAYGVLTICSSVVQILWITHSYLTTPVVTLQRRLTKLQGLRIISGLVVGLPWWVLWVPATMVAAQAFVGVDLYAKSPSWIYSSLALGLGGLALSLMTARWLAQRPPQTPCLRRLVDDLAGRSLVRVTRQLSEAEAFARD